MKFFSFFLTLILPIVLLAEGHAVKYENPFSIVYGGAGINIYGDYASVSSSVQCVDNNDDDVCEHNYNGYLFDARTMYKNSISTTTIPLNSSTETLSLPSDIDGADIVFAGLYWQANITGDDEDNYNTTFSTNGGIVERNIVSMQDASGTVHTLTADEIWYHDFWGDGTGDDGGHRSFYQGYKNVTTILQNSYNINITNNYTVGNIKSTIGSDDYTYFWADDTNEYNGVKIGFWGNWNLIVVYKHPSVLALSPQPKPKNITIFQGFDALIPLGVNTTKNVSLSLNGFLTPASTPIESKMLFYGSGGEKLLNYDGFEISDGKTNNFLAVPIETNEKILNPTDNIFNGSITSFGVAIDNSISYYPGLDSDEFNISSAMDTLQTTTTLNLFANNVNGTGDQIFPGLIAFSTDIYEPSFCYDYAYKQQGTYFTEINDGFTDPRLTGDYIVSNVPIEIGLYIRNYITSDLSVTDMVISISDINISQASYIDDTTKIARYGGIAQEEIVTTDVDGSFIKNIDIGTVQADEYFHIYYQLNPSVSSIDMPINAVADYNLSINGSTIPYTLSLGSDIPLCSGNNFYYYPQSGIFNVVHNDYYNHDISGPNEYFNIPTQITKREGDFKVLAMDPNDHDALSNTHLATAVAVEMIDVSAYHDTLASCSEAASSISERVLVIFNENITSVAFDQAALQSAITNGMTGLVNSSDFYTNSKRNAAFRVSYTADNNGSIISLIPISGASGTKYNVANFTDITGLDCASDVDGNPNNTDKVVSFCSNAGASYASAMTQAELATCMQCIYGINTKYLCSRDNFAIRPEAFLIKINDQNQTNPTLQVRIADDVSGVVIPSNTQTELAAGYDYQIEVNATNHLDNDSSPGYTYTFGNSVNELFEYQWSPSGTPTGCNDETNSTNSFRLVNGATDFNSSINQVGEYLLHMEDSTWTIVDNNPAFMSHHNGTYFLPSSTPDCVLNTALTKSVGAASTSLTPQNGCNISSDHNSSGSALKYRDYDIEFHPYKFDMNTTNTITTSYGESNSTIWPTIPYIYMADMNASQDMNDHLMSFHLNGSIGAVGYNNSILSNYVGGCYAQPIDLTIDKDHITTPIASTYSYKFDNRDINDTNTTGYPISVDINETALIINIAANDFTKNLNGSLNTLLYLNFNKDQTSVANPETITYNGYRSNCNVPANCTMNADLTTQTTLDGNATTALPTPLTIQHYYGRSHATHNQYIDRLNQEALIYYEVYCNGTIDGNICDKTLLQDGADSNSTDDPRWFINLQHNSTYGTAGDVNQKGPTAVVTQNTAPTGNHPDSVRLDYDGTRDYPYKTTMEMTSSPWLIYNKYNDTTNVNEFTVEYIKTSDSWAGISATDTTTDDNQTTQRTNRRTMW